MILNLYEGLWASLAAPLIKRLDAQTAHHRLLDAVRLMDGIDPAITAARVMNRRTLLDQPTRVGGVTLPHPLILSAGFVKGDGFADEDSALAAVESGRNIIPGWRTMPALVGAVEFGSFTRYPRVGNPGKVIWRDNATASTQNRVGLRNPGARAAACFFASHRDELPSIFGINLAVSPGVTDPDQEEREIIEAVGFFIQAGVNPSWYTLNLSCPNTEDDPGANQTADKARRLCAALVNAVDVPVWVKISPNLSADQISALMRTFAEVGVRAVIATNTLAQPTPDGSAVAGVGGGRLRADALATVHRLSAEKASHEYDSDIIGCGGIITGADMRVFHEAGASAFMVYSALVFRGPLAAAVILNEFAQSS